MSLEVKNSHKQAFKEIFHMKAVDGKIDKKGLMDLFKMIDYKVTEEQFNEMVTRIFVKKEQIGN
jgi:Ca2+-binding EF-hand superfamily protein